MSAWIPELADALKPRPGDCLGRHANSRQEGELANALASRRSMRGPA